MMLSKVIFLYVLILIPLAGFSQWKREKLKTADFSCTDQNARKYTGFKGTFRELSQQLTFQPKDTLENVRAIFTWVTENVQPPAKKTSLYTEVKDPGTTSVSAGPAGIPPSEVFRALCLEQNIITEVLTGICKNKDYKGTIAQTHAHTWNAVWINNHWYLIDCELARKTCEKDFYFLADPAKLIFTHFPENLYFQMNDQKITKTAFLKLPALFPGTSETKEFSLEKTLTKTEDFIDKKSIEYRNAMIWEKILLLE